MASSWPTLVIAGMGFVSTITASVYSQRHAARREDIKWEREQAHTRTLWEREDAARSYEDRRRVYLEFIAELDKIIGSSYWLMPDAPPPPEDYLADVGTCLLRVRVFGSLAAAQLAENAMQRLDDWVQSDNVSFRTVSDSLALLVEQARRDLLIQ